MKILLLEYITAGGLCNQPLPDSLLREGILMRDALLADFSEIADIELLTTHDARVNLPNFANVAMVVNESTNVIDLWKMLLLTCDAALIIAPETDGILSLLTQLLDSCAEKNYAIKNDGVKNLGSKLMAVDLFSNKQATYHALKDAAILTIPTYSADDFLRPEFFELNPSSTWLFNSGCVVKPIDGAGCSDTYYFKEVSALRLWLNEPAQLSQLARYIVQPYIAGTPASISMLCKAGEAWVLSCNQQLIEFNLSSNQTLINGSNFKLAKLDAAIQYQGCIVNGLSSNLKMMTELAQKIAAKFPELNGYVGVDVVIDNNDVYVVEINPRITTSYIGLRESLKCNPAQLLLNLAESEYSQNMHSTFKLPENMAANSVLINLNE